VHGLSTFPDVQDKFHIVVEDYEVPRVWQKSANPTVLRRQSNSADKKLKMGGTWIKNNHIWFSVIILKHRFQQIIDSEFQDTGGYISMMIVPNVTLFNSIMKERNDFEVIIVDTTYPWLSKDSIMFLESLLVGRCGKICETCDSYIGRICPFTKETSVVTVNGVADEKKCFAL